MNVHRGPSWLSSSRGPIGPRRQACADQGGLDAPAARIERKLGEEVERGRCVRFHLHESAGRARARQGAPKKDPAQDPAAARGRSPSSTGVEPRESIPRAHDPIHVQPTRPRRREPRPSARVIERGPRSALAAAPRLQAQVEERSPAGTDALPGATPSPQHTRGHRSSEAATTCSFPVPDHDRAPVQVRVAGELEVSGQTQQTAHFSSCVRREPRRCGPVIDRDRAPSW